MMPYIGLLKYVALAAIGIVIGWTAQGWRKDADIAAIQSAYTQATINSQEAAREKESEHNRQLQEAQHAAAARERAIRTDADRARNSSDRLRDQLATIKRNLPSLAADACRVKADALADVFGESVTEYRALAEEADRLANDRQLLIESWPK